MNSIDSFSISGCSSNGDSAFTNQFVIINGEIFIHDFFTHEIVFKIDMYFIK